MSGGNRSLAFLSSSSLVFVFLILVFKKSIAQFNELLAKNCLGTNQYLLPGQGIQDVSGSYSLWYMTSGNICIFNSLSNTGTSIWCAGASYPNHDPNYLAMQNDDNLVAYSKTNNPSTNFVTPTWSSVTGGRGNQGVAIIQKDGNFVVYQSAATIGPTYAVWNCGTNGGKPEPTGVSPICNTYSYSSPIPDSCFEGCIPGTYGSKGFINCANCAAGYYQASSYQSSCNCCPPGSYSSNVKATVCTYPLAGYYVPSSCQTSTLPCPAGSRSLGGSVSACSQCPVGYYAPSSTSSFQPCLAGSYSPGGFVSFCPICSTGYYQPLGAQGSQSPCPPNTYSGVGATACTPCASGFTSTSGSASCTVFYSFHPAIYSVLLYSFPTPPHTPFALPCLSPQTCLLHQN